MEKRVLLMVMMLWCLCASGQSDSLFVEKVLREAPADAGELYFARQFLGRPYVAHTLEVNDTERLVVNTRQLDCTTLVENALALALCHRRGQTTFGDFKACLTSLRYRGGVIDGYPSRLHYFSDWIDDNISMRFVSDVLTSAQRFTDVQTVSVNYMSTHAGSYKALAAHPEMVPVIAAQEKRLTGQKRRYIPKKSITASDEMRAVIHDGDIIAITCSKPGLDIAHLGFAVWHADGLHLLNASQLHKKVVEDNINLYQYLQKHPTHTGIRVIRGK